ALPAPGRGLAAGAGAGLPRGGDPLRRPHHRGPPAPGAAGPLAGRAARRGRRRPVRAAAAAAVAPGRGPAGTAGTRLAGRLGTVQQRLRAQGIHGAVRGRGRGPGDAGRRSRPARTLRAAPGQRSGLRHQPAGAPGLLLPPAPGLGRALRPVPGAAPGHAAADAMNTLRRLLVLLAIATAPGAAPADDGQRGRAPAHEFSLVTLNLYHDRDDWPRRRVQIVEELRRLRPDAIALQEVLQHEDLPNQAVWLARE